MADRPTTTSEPVDPQAPGDRRGGHRRRSSATATAARAWTRSPPRRRLEADRLQALRRQGAPLLRDRERARSTRPATPSTTRCSSLQDSGDLEADLRDLARRQLAAVMQPRLLQLRRLVIGEAGRFPELGRTFYERGPGRTIAALAAAFERLAARGVLRARRPARSRPTQFNWLIMSAPLNQAMLLGHDDPPEPRRARPLRRRRRAHVPRRLRPRRIDSGARDVRHRRRLVHDGHEGRRLGPRRARGGRGPGASSGSRCRAPAGTSRTPRTGGARPQRPCGGRCRRSTPATSRRSASRTSARRSPAWTSTARAVRPAIVWMDVRAARQVEALGSEDDPPADREAAGHHARALQAAVAARARAGGARAHALGGRRRRLPRQPPHRHLAHDDGLRRSARPARHGAARLGRRAARARRAHARARAGARRARARSSASCRPARPSSSASRPGCAWSAARATGSRPGLGANAARPGRAYLNLGTAVVAGTVSESYAWDVAFRTLIGAVPGTYIMETLLQGGTYTVDWFLSRIAVARRARAWASACATSTCWRRRPRASGRAPRACCCCPTGRARSRRTGIPTRAGCSSASPAITARSTSSAR